MAAGVARGPRGGRLDRRDRRPARRPTRSSRASSRRASGSRRGRRALRRGDPDHRPVPRSAPRSTSRCRRAPSALSAQAKGAGMISPSFATMLCFVQTDAALEPETADLLLGVCVKRSFDRISVDGQLSTNDTVILHGSGASGVAVAPESEDELRLGEALDALLRRLALLIVARRRGRAARRPRRRARRPRADGRRAPRARSPTRRWSRPRCTAATRTGAGSPRPSARALHGTAPLPLDIWIEDVQVCAAAPRVPFDVRRARAGGRRRGGRVRGRPARRGRRDRGLLLRPLARLRDDQRGVHDVIGRSAPTSAPCSRRCRTSASSTAAPS